MSPKTSNYLKAEVYCASLLEKKVPLKQITIKFLNGFKRKFRKDIEQVHYSFENGRHYFNLEVNRDSIYDQLPQGLVHQTRGRGRVQGVKDMVNEHKRFKEEEMAARKFFAPIDQEIFNYKIIAELEERISIFNLEQGELTEEHYNFWNISSELPSRSSAEMVRLMPYIKKIKGDRKNTEDALSMILQKIVTSVEQIEFSNIEQPVQGEIAESRLGSTVTQCKNFEEPILTWTFTIYGISPEETHLYTKDKPYGKLLERFKQLYIPLEVESKFEFKMDKSANNNQSMDMVLGYGSTL